MARTHSFVASAFAGALGLAAIQAAAQQPPPLSLQGALQRAAVAFRENKGQWDERARFLARLPGLDYWATRDGIVLDQYRLVPGNEAPPRHDPGDKVSMVGRGRREGHVIVMRFVGASPSTGTMAYGQQKDTMDFFVRRD